MSDQNDDLRAADEDLAAGRTKEAGQVFAAIEASHYGETRRALMADPIIRGMAEELRGADLGRFTHEDGTPQFWFMNAALRGYQAKGGTIGTHIGGPVEAILALLAETGGGE